jgi:NTP pyrophosphatase (non-canonical NTP hydrolase)
MDSMDVARIQKHQRTFVRQRKWEKYHTPKNLSVALAVEAAELMEIFQWLTPNEAKRVMQDPDRVIAVSHELADVFFYLLRLADILKVDLEEAFWEKMRHNAAKYPVRLAKGNARKYTELRLNKRKPRQK